eukprot:4712624-Lingulodinium_polyedra.AAC.2
MAHAMDQATVAWTCLSEAGELWWDGFNPQAHPAVVVKQSVPQCIFHTNCVKPCEPLSRLVQPLRFCLSRPLLASGVRPV